MEVPQSIIVGVTDREEIRRANENIQAFFDSLQEKACGILGISYEKNDTRFPRNIRGLYVPPGMLLNERVYGLAHKINGYEIGIGFVTTRHIDNDKLSFDFFENLKILEKLAKQHF